MISDERYFIPLALLSEHLPLTNGLKRLDAYLQGDGPSRPRKPGRMEVVGDLFAEIGTEKEFLRQPGLGTVSLSALKRDLAAFGLAFPQPDFDVRAWTAADRSALPVERMAELRALVADRAYRPPFNPIASMQGTLRLQAAALTTMADALAAGTLSEGAAKAFDIFVAAKKNKGRIICTGVGKSGHVARKAAATLASTDSKAIFIHATEASHGDLGMMDENDVVLAFSKSGETRELADVIAHCQKFNKPLIAITGEENSTLAKAATALLLLPEHAEGNDVNAPATSTTLQMALGDALALALLAERGFTPHDFKQFHPGGKLGGELRKVSEVMEPCAIITAVGLDAPVFMAIREFQRGSLVVLDEREAVAGIYTTSKFASDMAERKDTPGDLGDFLHQPISHVMTPDPVAVDPDEFNNVALGIMRGNNRLNREINDLVVIGPNRRLLGMLRRVDAEKATL